LPPRGAHGEGRGTGGVGHWLQSAGRGQCPATLIADHMSWDLHSRAPSESKVGTAGVGLSNGVSALGGVARLLVGTGRDGLARSRFGYGLGASVPARWEGHGPPSSRYGPGTDCRHESRSRNADPCVDALARLSSERWARAGSVQGRGDPGLACWGGAGDRQELARGWRSGAVGGGGACTGEVEASGPSCSLRTSTNGCGGVLDYTLREG
jgi:hypothetical protein